MGAAKKDRLLNGCPEAFGYHRHLSLRISKDWCKASYDYLQEVDEVTQFVNDLEMVRGYFDQFKRTTASYFMRPWPDLKQKESNDLLAAHFRGDTKEDFLRLVRVMERLDSRWSESCPHWRALATRSQLGLASALRYGIPSAEFRDVCRECQTKRRHSRTVDFGL